MPAPDEASGSLAASVPSVGLENRQELEGGETIGKFSDLPKEARERVDNVLKTVLSSGIPALTSLRDSLGRHEGAETPEELEVLRDLLPGLEKLVPAVHEGLNIRPLWKVTPEVHRIIKDLESAAGTFDAGGHAPLASLARSLALWATAFLELQALDLDTFDTFDVKRRKARTMLRGAGEFGPEIATNTLLLEPFLFMMAGEKSLGQPGGVTAGSLMEQAAQAAADADTELAVILRENEATIREAFHATYEGMVQLYRAVNRFTYARMLFAEFDFDSLADEPLHLEAQEAFRLLSQGGLGGDFRTLTNYSEALLHLLKATGQFAKLIQSVFHSVYTGSPKALRTLKLEIREGRRAVIQAGLDFRSLVGYSDALTTQVNNLARLATPDGKDFGKYSGLVAAAVFLPAVLVLSFVNLQYGLGLDAPTVLEYSFLSGLLAGFGLAAMKFTPQGLFHIPWLGGGGASGGTPEKPAGK